MARFARGASPCHCLEFRLQAVGVPATDGRLDGSPCGEKTEGVICVRMASDSTVTVSQAQANLPKLVKRDSFASSRHGQIAGVYLSRDRIEALVETMELLSDPDFMTALWEYASGKMKFKGVECLDED